MSAGDTDGQFDSRILVCMCGCVGIYLCVGVYVCVRIRVVVCVCECMRM